jgi:hypothetical protein
MPVVTTTASIGPAFSRFSVVSFVPFPIPFTKLHGTFSEAAFATLDQGQWR